MKLWVVDASVAAKWFLPEPNHEKAKQFLQEEEYFVVPDYFFIDMESLFTKKVRQRLLTISEAEEAVNKLNQLPLQHVDWYRLRETAFHLAAGFSVSYYDAIYAALALTIKSTLISADRRLIKAVKSLKPKPDAISLKKYINTKL